MKPCTCNGRRLLVRDEGLLCEACGKVYQIVLVSPAVKRLVEAVEAFRFEIAPLKSKTAKEGQLWVEVSRALKAVRDEMGL